MDFFIYICFMNITLNYLDGWWFTYNGASDVWSAAQTEDRNDVNNDYTSEKVLRGNTFETLRDLIIKHKGNLNNINKVYE